MCGGKTGNFFGWTHLPVKPDIFTIGKAITAGPFPLSGALYNEKISSVVGTNFLWDHGYTYSFTLPGAASALEFISVLEKEKLLDNHSHLVARAIDTFESQGFKIINRFGLFFKIEHGDSGMFFMIPLNADDEYFNVLAQNLAVQK
jgi:adenosylmethionine-8-amino-7-oxononanoate aminotransferase